MNLKEAGTSKQRTIDLYNQRRQQAVDLLEELEAAAIRLQFNRKAEDLSAAVKRMKDDQFEVMVVGEFSSGKSTFINALLGTDVLPTAITPCTALLTRIAYGTEQNIRIIKRDGGEERLSKEAFRQLIAPDIPDDNEEDRLRARREAERIASIAYADVQMPTSLGSDGVILIDSPGTNDMDAAREAITNHYIPSSDAAIFVIHGMRPLTQSEKSFLYRIKDADISKIFFVVTFKDMLRTDSDRIRVLERVRNEVNDIMQTEHVFLVSSRHELLNQQYPGGLGMPTMRTPLLKQEETGFRELEEGLQRFLAVDRGAAKLGKPISRGIRIINDMIRYHIEFERRTLLNRMTDAQQSIGGLREQLERTRSQGIQAIAAMRNRLSADGVELQQWYKGELKAVASFASEEMERVYRHHSNTALTKETIEKKTAVREKELQTELEKRMRSYEEQAIIRANKDMQAELGRYESLLGGMLGSEFSAGTDSNDYSNGMDNVPLSGFHSPLANMMIDKADELLDRGGFLRGVTGIGIGIAGAIVEGAARLFGWLFGSSKPSPYEQLKEEVDNRYNKPISDKCKQLEKYWTNRTQKLTDGYEQGIEHSTDDSRKQLDSVVRNFQLSEEETKRKLEELEMQEQALKNIAVRLQVLNEEVQQPC
ncbi:dynamin family protein [Paenibacillus sp. NEAU-GSW1]|uniref:dynamin family protein n=1 Tax=Paenibacillus sp. NEAU-GSW1 TaxID=2682486 RepID=UPI0015648A98|nr:dynamin family protein [Paenibacillus sp. NEAU-GSW1]